VTSETKQVRLVWREALLFRGGEPGGPETVIDGDNAEAPGPMLQLLLSAAACSGSDVVTILEKMRVRLRSFRIEASGVRRAEEPRRYLSLHLEYYLSGDRLDRDKATRAVELSVTKYCSVIHSLASDIRITHGISLA
jgi:putative redox protein